MIKTILLGLFLSSGLALYAQVPAVPDTAKIIDHMRRDNLAAAADLARISNLSAPSPQMQRAEKLLTDANRRSVNDPARLELKGDVARLLGSDDAAIGFYQNALDRIEEHFEKFGKRTVGAGFRVFTM